jgi:hypothetical protein
MTFSFKKALATTIYGAILLLGAHFGIIGVLIALLVILHCKFIWAWAEAIREADETLAFGASELEKRAERTLSKPCASAQMALREKAVLHHGERVRLRVLCEGDPRLLELCGLTSKEQS